MIQPRDNSVCFVCKYKNKQQLVSVNETGSLNRALAWEGFWFWVRYSV